MTQVSNQQLYALAVVGEYSTGDDPSGIESGLAKKFDKEFRTYRIKYPNNPWEFVKQAAMLDFHQGFDDDTVCQEIWNAVMGKGVGNV